MTDPHSQNPIITHKLAQIADFERNAEAFTQIAADAATPERAAELQSFADIAHRQVLQLQVEIALQKQYSNNHGEEVQS